MVDSFQEKSDLRAPLLTGTDNYDWWKSQMETFLSKNPLVLRVFQKGPNEFLDNNGKPKDVDDLTPKDLTKFGYNEKLGVHSLAASINLDMTKFLHSSL